MATTTNYGWTTPDDTGLVKDGASAIRTLGSAIDSTVKTVSDAAVTKSTFTTKGDLLTTTGASTIARLGVGTDGQVLTADAASSSGIKWATPSSGGLTLISEQIASASTGISFSSISGNYKQLLLIWDGIYHSTTGTDIVLRINNDSTATNYYAIGLTNSSALALSNNQGGTAAVQNSTSTPMFGTEANNGSTEYGRSIKGFFLLDNYASTSKYKFFKAENSFYQVAAAQYRSSIFRGEYLSTSAVTSLDIVRTAGTATFSNMANTSIRLYGVA